MTSLHVSSNVLSETEPPFVWERQVRPAVDAIVAPWAEFPRAIVVGNAGSGKSTVLRHLHRKLAADDRDASLLAGTDLDVTRVPGSHVLLVDDLHLMSAAQLEGVRTRSNDPDAALVVASRPWPASDALTAISRRLEQTRPAIVLGHVSRSDVLTFLETRDERLSNHCLDHILLATGGVSWLVTEALAAHDERDCVDDEEHRELARILEERIAHRLDTVDSDLRRTIEVLAIVGGRSRPIVGTPEHSDESIMKGYAEGLLTRNGQPVPLVRATIRSTIPARRIIDVSSSLAEVIARSAGSDDSGSDDWAGLIGDPQVGAALVQHGDGMLEDHPRRALELYGAALDSGVDPASIAARRAQAAWAANDLDAAGALIDAAPARSTDRDRLADVAAATWAGRGMMEQASAVYRATRPGNPDSRVRAMIAEYGVGEFDEATEIAHEFAAAGSTGTPTALGVSMQLLGRGLAASVAREAAPALLVDLVRASEMYTSSRSSAAIPELPAVIAATVAMNLGDLATAHSVIDDAIAGRQGGEWARQRLLLWRAWVAVQRAWPAEARESLARALDFAPALSPRDALLAHAVQVAIARRYEDAAGLEAAWRQARPSILRTEIDLYLLLPLVELVCSAAKVGDSEHVESHVARGFEIVERLGAPALWSAQLRWAGIQQGILLNRPDDLTPHAHALVAAAPTSRIAAVMAKAGRVWTSVLAGTVNADAVESSARGLASAGLAWDAARLAGHGAARTTDRKVAARLLSCARDLHPNEAARRPAASATEASPAPAQSAPGTEVLSDRELEVARLVLQGKTYAEIGETIFISPRTAEHHIAHIRRRLGASSRSEVIAKLRVLIEESGTAEGVSAAGGGNTDAPP
ncbi:LuxR C-terminal-related transcriptional regulator [Agromyces laixinhei]|uniref:LuxR C-terminal-related transcriptional regulator n=1 Tax=Agromyces laixinhei TaxID=2585717 RepID=UPI0012EED3F3|nr:LuxR C-terminal-related transcriptional regulator [Agromyces laixinhei]